MPVIHASTHRRHVPSPTRAHRNHRADCSDAWFRVVTQAVGAFTVPQVHDPQLGAGDQELGSAGAGGVRVAGHAVVLHARGGAAHTEGGPVLQDHG